MDKRNYKIGQYHYGRKYSKWGVWVVVRIANGWTYSESVETFSTRNEAREYTFKMNGWGDPKNRVAEF